MHKAKAKKDSSRNAIKRRCHSIITMNWLTDLETVFICCPKTTLVTLKHQIIHSLHWVIHIQFASEWSTKSCFCRSREAFLLNMEGKISVILSSCCQCRDVSSHFDHCFWLWHRATMDPCSIKDENAFNVASHPVQTLDPWYPLRDICFP